MRKNPGDIELGKRLKELRTLIGEANGRAMITQPDLADMVKVSRALISLLEIGEAPISKATKYKFEKVFPAEVMVWLISGKGSPSAFIGKIPKIKGETPKKESFDTKKELSMEGYKPSILFLDRLMPRSRMDVLKLIDDMNQQATQRMNIPWWNGQLHFSFIILDKALDPPYAPGNVMAAKLEEDFAHVKYGDVHAVHAWDKQFVRIVIEDPANRENIILRASKRLRDEYPDITMPKKDVELIAIALGGADLNLVSLSHVA